MHFSRVQLQLEISLISLLLSGSNGSIITERNTTEQNDFTQIPSSKVLNWTPCLSRYECANLDVPLDYSKPNGTRATIPLIKIPAQPDSPNGTYQGLLLTNPGGPGELGVDFILHSGYSSLVPVVGTNYDIVSFDPRGMGRSVPLANCSLGATSGLARRADGLDGPSLPLEYWTETFEPFKTFGQACQATIGGPDDAGPHMSTAVVATDMLSIAEAFAATEQGRSIPDSSFVNYWGFSYGTFIGHTFASMYPERVGRFVFDGVVDAEDYISGRHFSDIFEVDPVILSFFDYCFAAGPTLCPFTGTSPQAIHNRFDNIFTHLNASLAIEQKWENATTITLALAQIKGLLHSVVNQPITTFPIMGKALVGLEGIIGNLSTAGLLEISEFGKNSSPQIPGTRETLQEWLPAVFCSETPSIFNKTYADLEPDIKELERQSFIAGELWASLKSSCTGWSIRAVSRFAGPFGGNTANPILFVSNTIDPATPLKNSQTWSPKYKDSVVLVTDGVGHTSLGTNNACANTKLGRFFQTGVLPAADTVCPLEPGQFGVLLKGLSPDVDTNVGVGDTTSSNDNAINSGNNNTDTAQNSASATGIGEGSLILGLLCSFSLLMSLQ